MVVLMLMCELDMGKDMPEEERKKFAARAVKEVMRSL
jgi:hypothetical protein